MTFSNAQSSHVEGENLTTTEAGSLHHPTLVAVADALSNLRYGTINLTVHNGKVVQLDVTERQRFT